MERPLELASATVLPCGGVSEVRRNEGKYVHPGGCADGPRCCALGAVSCCTHGAPDVAPSRC
jgi:hypothetical protein